MLNNKNSFKKLIAALSSIYPNVPLPEGFDDFLWKRMIVEAYCKKRRNLETEGKVPEKAYYVLSGKVIVNGFVDGLPYTESIYRENTIVALNAFMKQENSLHTITATEGTLVWSISHEMMRDMYAKWPEMKAFALQAALIYMELKGSQRSTLLALPEEERVGEFYKAFTGLLPAKKSAIRDAEIGAYLAMPVRRLRYWRRKMG